jgi:hypothetical protein
MGLWHGRPPLVDQDNFVSDGERRKRQFVILRAAKNFAEMSPFAALRVTGCVWGDGLRLG